MKLYDYPPSGNGYKVRLILSHLGLGYQHVHVDILRGETRTPEFLARNPNGKIPVLETDDGCACAESNAIIYFLAKGTPYWPAGRKEQTEVLQWLFFEQYSHEPNIATARFVMHFVPPDDERRQGLPGMTKRGYQALDVMEGHLASRSHFVADRYTIADIALYAYTHVAHEGGFDLGAYPKVRAWLARVAAEPGHIPITKG